MTEFIARGVGYDNDDSVNIGLQTQLPDDDDRSATYGTKIWENKSKYHFVIPSTLATLASGIHNDANFADDVGTFLHAQEDTYAHCTGKGDRNWDYYGDWFWFQNQGGSVGHLFHGHNPDFTWEAPDKSMRMAWRVFEDLRHIKEKSNSYPDPGFATGDTPTDETDPVWIKIKAKGTLEKFMAFGANGEVNVYDAAFGSEITRQSMLDKIRILFPGFTVRSDLDQIDDRFLTPDEKDFKNFRNVAGHRFGTYQNISTPKGATLLMQPGAFGSVGGSVVP
jgi:hypothetical protein